MIHELSSLMFSENKGYILSSQSYSVHGVAISSPNCQAVKIQIKWLNFWAILN